MTMNKIHPAVICVGLACLTILECYALHMGLNGTLLKMVLVVVAGIIGVTIPIPKFMSK